MHHRTAAIGLLAILALAGCSTGTGTDSDSKPSPSPTSKSLAAEWTPKLQQAATADASVCNHVGDRSCATHLTGIMFAVSDVENAIAAGAGPGKYPQSTVEIEKINKASEAYNDHECLGDENADIAGSPCPDDAQTILSGAEALPLALTADEQ
ncbi:hypothetical protein ABT119_06055 [Streptomyces sp. NPDC001910]|uniref:hypothetical protein n=1 Tax=Streptomyces sp. NPDC001910 TaxID=3154403 RepID=UPI00331E7F41